MTGLMKIAALLSLAPTILAVPRPAQALLPLPVATDTNACGIVADQQTRQLAANPGGTYKCTYMYPSLFSRTSQ